MVAQRAVGVQLACVIRTVRTWRLEACFVGALPSPAFVPGLAGAAPVPVAAVPPGLAALALRGCPKKQHSSTEAAAASGNMSRCLGALLAKNFPSAPEA